MIAFALLAVVGWVAYGATRRRLWIERERASADVARAATERLDHTLRARARPDTDAARAFDAASGRPAS